MKIQLRRSQRGKNSTQLQAGRDIVVYEPSGEETIKLVEFMAEALRKEFSHLADAKIYEALSNFQSRYAAAMLVHPELISASADPDFQFNIREAQLGAVRSGGDDDINRLIDILTARAGMDPTPRRRMATKKALEVAAQLSPDALTGLSAMWYWTEHHFLTAHEVDDFLSAINTHLSPLVEAGLPSGQSWLSDLDLLGCLQVSHVTGTWKRAIEILMNKCPGFVCEGITGDIDEVRLAMNSIASGLDNLVVGHPFLEGEFALAGNSAYDFRSIVIERVGKERLEDNVSKSAFELAIASNGYDRRSPEATDAFTSRVNEDSVLKTFADWWGDSFPGMTLTASGVTIAHTHMRKLMPEDMTMPSLDDYLK